MLKEILDPAECAECRICCGFVESDKWEIPLVFGELAEHLQSRYPRKLVPRANEYVFDMEFHGSEIIPCPALTDKGCALGDGKPFDCRVWPFRVNDLNGTQVITASPVCPAVSKLPLKTISEFVNGGFSQKMFAEADLHPDMVKPYISGYPIVCVRNAGEM